MYNKSVNLRLNAVRHYLENGESLRKTAKRFNVNYWNVFKWVKLYKTKGKEGILSTYNRPRCRTAKELEERIALLKEKIPTLTVRGAKKILENEGITISIKGIWGIWKRNGYAGFKKENMTNEFIEYCPWTKEARSKFERVKELMNLGRLKESSETVNSIPILPKNDTILEIPDDQLNVKRKVEKIESSFGKIPIHSYLKRTKELYCKLRKENLNYSALRVGISEVIALSWLSKPEQQLNKIEELKKLTSIIDSHNKQKGSYVLFEPRFTLLINEGISYASLMKIEKAKKIASKCRQLLRSKENVSPYFMFNIGRLYTYLGEYKTAEHWLLKALDRVDESIKKHIKGILARISLSKCEYKQANALARSAEFGLWIPNSYVLIFRSLLCLMNGMAQKAIILSLKSLSQSKKEELNNAIFSASLIIASAHCSMDDRKRAVCVLERSLRLFSKNKLKREEVIFKILISLMQSTYNPYVIMPSDKNLLPTIKLALLIKSGKYFKALSYARKKYLMHYFYNYIFFAPEIITYLIKKGKNVGLPKAILKLPLFNKEVPVCHIKFLGSLIVFKNQQYLKTKLRPKDIAFLIYLTVKAMEPKRSVRLNEVYANFWSKSKNPSRNLSHLLVRIKKALQIPSHLLTISSKTAYPSLINEGIHFTTDYQEFEQTLTTAHALERADEWSFAKKEYLRAFRLFRGEPFKKIYDPWSEYMRRVILNSLETAVVCFARSCLEHKNKTDAREVLNKVSKIIPNSEEIREMVKDS
ncbi:MAG: transposase [bacterium]